MADWHFGQESRMGRTQSIISALNYLFTLCFVPDISLCETYPFISGGS